MNDVWRAAREYAERGWSVIPTNPNKRPVESWQRWQTEIASPRQIDSWFRVEVGKRCVAIICGQISGIVIFDIERPWVQLYRDLPPTLTAMSQSGGVHWYYKYPEGVDLMKIINVDGEHHGDIRTNGQYALAPPSKGTSGLYSWMRPGEPSECPDGYERPPVTRREVTYNRPMVTTGLYRDGDYPSRSERIMAIARMVKLRGGGFDEFRNEVVNDWSGSKLDEKTNPDKWLREQKWDVCDPGIGTDGEVVWSNLVCIRRQKKTELGERVVLEFVTDDGREIYQGVTLIDGTERTEALKAALPRGIKTGQRVQLLIRQMTWRGNTTWKVGRFLAGTEK